MAQHSGAGRPLVALDVTPLQNAHRLRGIGRYVSGLATALLAQQEIVIEVWGWDGDRPFEVPAPHRARWLPRFGLPRTRWSWTLGPIGMRLRARRSQALAVHVTDPRAFTPLGRPTLTTVYDLIPLLEPDARPTGSEWRHYQRYLARLSQASGIFAISSQTATDLRQHLHIPPPPVWIAPPGVEPSPGRREGDAGGRRSERPYFLYLGSADRHKNVALIIQAMTIAKDLPERLWIAGPWYPPDRRFLTDLVARAGIEPARVECRGFVPEDELDCLIRGATAVILPSRREGFGLPVAEAMAAGGAVLHSRLPVLSEISGDAALTFDPASANDLAAAMEAVAKDPALRAQLIARGRARAAGLTWERALAATLLAYRLAVKA